jgi:DNA-binding transcriptional ArsR family regulator
VSIHLGPYSRGVSEEPPRRQLTLRDAREIRALAHPARLEVLSRLQGPRRVMTATELAEYCGLSPSAMSYHLRAMERAGMVERAEAEDGRERPWRLAFDQLTTDADVDSPGAKVAESLLIEAFMKEDTRHVVDFVATEPKGPWRDATTLNGMTLVLTTEELETMQAEIREVTKKYAVQSRAEPPEGSRRVRFRILVVPED